MADKSLIPLPVAPEEYSLLDQSNLRSGLEGNHSRHSCGYCWCEKDEEIRNLRSL